MYNAVISPGFNSSPSLRSFYFIYISACEKPVGDNEERPVHVV